MRWADETGEQIEGFSREIYLDVSGDPATCVTELQLVLHERSPTEERGAG